jgi:hypothetical protein
LGDWGISSECARKSCPYYCVSIVCIDSDEILR